MPDSMDLRPIGSVRVREPEGVTEIDVRAEYAEGLEGVDALEYLWVLYWMHELGPGDRRRLRTHPMGDTGRPEQGVFSLHSPMRPNPIGMTRIRLLERRGNRLIVEGLDARDGSPVLDLKSG